MPAGEAPLPKRLGVNLLYLVPAEVGGSEIYARNLLAALRAVVPDLEIVAYAGPEAIESLRTEPWANGMELVGAPVKSRSKPLRVGGELTWLPLRARRDGVDVLHSLGTTSPPICPAASVVTVLDLIYRHYPETFPRASRFGLRVVVPAGARRADRVIAISEAGKRDIVETLRLDPEKIDVVYLGSALRHKNLARLFEAFGLLAREREARLVLVGHAGLEQEALRARAAALGVGERVLFTGWVDDSDLEGFYASATVFVYPSLIEGFGMPLLEAMRRGVPVACSNVSALPEVAGDAAEHFDPYDPAAIAAAIGRLLDDESRRGELIARGRRRFREFTWERAALGTLESYRRALLARNRNNTQRQ